jgi:hypothetical protein
VPEYQIIDDELFEEVTELRHRFQNEDASQETMPEKRKQANINTIKQMYEDFLQMT